MPAVAATDAVGLGGILPVESDRVDLPIDDRVPVGGEIDESRGLIHRQQFVDVPTAHRQRAAQRAIEVVEIQVICAGSFRRPDERRLLFQKTQVVRQIDPHRRGLRDQRSLPQCGGIDQDEVEPLLIAGEALEGEPAAIRRPVDAREINVRIGAQIDPTRVAGERVALFHHLGSVGVDLRAAGDRHGAVVEPLVCDGRVVGGPPVAAGLHQFFLSDEFRLGIVDGAAAVGGQTTLVTPLEVDHPQILIAHEGHVAAARGHLRVDDGLGRMREPAKRGIGGNVQIIEIQIAAEREQYVSTVRRPIVVDDPMIVGGSLPFAPRPFGIRQIFLGRESHRIHAHLQPPGLDVIRPQVELVPIRWPAAQQPHAASVRGNFDSPRRGAGERGIGKDPFEREIARRGGHGKQDQQQAADRTHWLISVQAARKNRRPSHAQTPAAWIGNHCRSTRAAPRSSSWLVSCRPSPRPPCRR